MKNTQSYSLSICWNSTVISNSQLTNYSSNNCWLIVNYSSWMKIKCGTRSLFTSYWFNGHFKSHSLNLGSILHLRHAGAQCTDPHSLLYSLWKRVYSFFSFHIPIIISSLYTIVHSECICAGWYGPHWSISVCLPRLYIVTLSSA